MANTAQTVHQSDSQVSIVAGWIAGRHCLQQVAPGFEANCGFVDWKFLETVGNGLVVGVSLAWMARSMTM